MRRISSTGMSAAPVTARRRVDRSCAVAVGMVEDRLVQRRRTREHGHRLLGRPCAGRSSTSNTGLRDDRGAAHERREAARLVPEHVEERVDDQVAVAGDAGRPCRTSRRTARSVCACVITTPFGAPGRARREQHVAHVVAGDRADPTVDDAVVDRCRRWPGTRATTGRPRCRRRSPRPSAAGAARSAVRPASRRSRRRGTRRR